MKRKAPLAISITIIIGTVMSSLNQWLLATQFEKSDYGLFASSWAIAQLILQFIIFGAHHFLLNRGGGASYVHWLPYAITLALLNSSIILVAMLLSSVLIGFTADSSMTYILFVWAILTIPVTFIYTHFQRTRNTLLIGLWPLAQIFGRSFAILAVLILGFSLREVSVGFALSALILTLIAIALASNNGLIYKGRLSSLRPSRLVTVVRHTAPYFTFEFMEKIDLKLAVPLCLWLLGPTESASLAIAIGVLLAALIVPQGLFQRYYLATLHQWSRNSANQLTLFVFKVALFLFVVSALGALLLYPFLEEVISFVFMDRYNETVGLITVMIFTVPFLLVTNIINNRFLSINDISVLQTFQIASFGVFLALFIGLTNTFALLGACYAILIYRIIYLIGLLALISIRNKA